VVHGAALKRTEVCAYNVMECVATNIIGTQNVARACIDAGVGKAVLLNSDKAVLGTTTYGLSKAMAERIFLNANAYSGERGTKFASCLYGNISGSTGSVIPIWRKQLETSDTVTVTDPEATRFWMYRHEASELVLKAINEMRGGDVFIPTLPAYRVGDLADAMGAKMNIIGMAENEKMHEEMRPGETSELARRMTIKELQDGLKRV
jgi:UDP-N-acetylglucosamine 4,6-dehydratase